MENLKCPECGEDIWDVPSGSKLAKCWNGDAHADGRPLAFDTMTDDDDDDDGTAMAEFISQNRSEIDAAIRSQCDNLGDLDDDDREQWIENDEALYTWARESGVPV